MARTAKTGIPPERKEPLLRKLASNFIHHPVVEISILVLILVSVGLLFVEVAFIESEVWLDRLQIVNDVLTGIFVLELVIRYWVARKKRRFFQRYWIDILAVLPIIRPLRLLRVLRLLRLFRAGVLLNRRLSTLKGFFQGTTRELTALAAVTLIIVLGASTTMHLVEGGTNPNFAEFESAVWFSVFSLVGGEPIAGEPDSQLGRVTTLVLMIGGLTVFGMFVGTISATMVSRLSGRLEVQEMDLDELRGHVVVCGWNLSGPAVMLELFGPGNPRNQAVVLITEGGEVPPTLPEDGIRQEHLYHLHGDFTKVDVLEQANIREASRAILLKDELIPRSDQDRDARTVLAALTIERLAPHIFTCAELTSRESEPLLKMAGVEEIVVGHQYAGNILGAASRTLGLVGVLDEILGTAGGNAFYSSTVPMAFAGRTVRELREVLEQKHQAVLISVEQVDPEDNVRLCVNPTPGQELAAGERILVLARRPIRWS